MIIHTVSPGDTVFSVARQYGVPVTRIITDNMLTTPGRLVVGQDLVILFPTVTHTVRGGETLQSIANLYGTDLVTLYRNNPQLNGVPQIFPGQVLNIAYETPPLGEISVNGYAYPFIDREVLRRTLPYLTYLSIFSYGIRPDGTLFPPTGGDEELIAIAKEYGTVPLLVLTSLTENGTFSSGLARDVIADPALSERVIDDIARIVPEKGYGGVDVDFEYVPGENAGDYADFVRRINDRLGDDYTVLVSLAPKYRANQGGLLYGGHDYGGLGAAADGTLLMTYEWGYTYGPPLAVSPINEVRRVIDWYTPVAFLGTVAVFALIFGGPSAILYHLFAGGLMLGALFMATDYVTSPVTPLGKLLMGFGCGLITALFRFCSNASEGVSYAILLMNLATPLIDKYITKRRFGGEVKSRA